MSGMTKIGLSKVEVGVWYDKNRDYQYPMLKLVSGMTKIGIIQGKSWCLV